MARKGRRRRGRPRGTGQAPPIIDQTSAFDQRAFVEVVGVAEAAIAQASIAGSQGDPRTPQRFSTHHQPNKKIYKMHHSEILQISKGIQHKIQFSRIPETSIFLILRFHILCLNSLNTHI